MIKTAGVLAVTVLFTNGIYAQSADKFFLGISSGIASGWWIYTLGTGAGIDRTDNEPKITIEGELVYKPSRFGIGLGVAYSFLTDNTMEEFEDTPVRRRKYFIAHESVRLWQFYLQGEYDLYSGGRYSLSPQVKAGSFSIETIHPEKDNFGEKFLLELSALNQVTLSDQIGLTLRPFYQVLLMSVKQETLTGEKHRIFSLGLALGLRYRI